MLGTTRVATRLRMLIASLLAFSILMPFAAGCGRSDTGSAASMSQPPPGSYSGQTYGTVPAPTQARRSGMTTGQKVAVLAGTAALIYLYNKHKNAQGVGAQGQYYRSKNGRIYYRDAQGNAVWVTPPAGGIQVPADVAQRYNQAAQTGNYDVNDPYVNGSNSAPGPATGY